MLLYCYSNCRVTFMAIEVFLKTPDYSSEHVRIISLEIAIPLVSV